MSNRAYYAAEVPFSLEQTWPVLGFDAPGWTYSGGGRREVGDDPHATNARWGEPR